MNWLRKLLLLRQIATGVKGVGITPLFAFCDTWAPLLVVRLVLTSAICDQMILCFWCLQIYVFSFVEQNFEKLMCVARFVKLNTGFPVRWGHEDIGQMLYKINTRSPSDELALNT